MVDNQSRRTFFIAALAGTASLSLAAWPAGAAGKRASKERVIKIEARKFAYSPNVIELKVGIPVTLEFTSIDFVHGMHIPDMNIRSDLMPGQVTRVKITPDKTGRFTFLCDNFCGAGHEEMNGTLIVKA
ncbi:MAG: cupredoxin domain-containing protein [Pseudomonadota bacterium]